MQPNMLPLSYIASAGAPRHGESTRDLNRRLAYEACRDELRWSIAVDDERELRSLRTSGTIFDAVRTGVGNVLISIGERLAPRGLETNRAA